MGLMDKVKAQATVLADKAQTGMQQGQVKIQEMQAGKQVDHLLRELGAYVFLSERGRTQPDSEAKVADLLSQLDALEAAGTPVTVTMDPPPPPPPPPGERFPSPIRRARPALLPHPRLLRRLPSPARRRPGAPFPSRVVVSPASRP